MPMGVSQVMAAFEAGELSSTPPYVFWKMFPKALLNTFENWCGKNTGRLPRKSMKTQIPSSCTKPPMNRRLWEWS